MLHRRCVGDGIILFVIARCGNTLIYACGHSRYGLWRKIVTNRLSDSVLELLIKGFTGTTKKGENISPSLLEEIKTKCPSLETLGVCYCDMRNIPAQCLPQNSKSLLLDHSIVPLCWFEGLQCETFFPSLLQLSLTLHLGWEFRPP